MKGIERFMKKRRISYKISSFIIVIALVVGILNYNSSSILADNILDNNQNQVVSQAEKMQVSEDGMVEYIKSINQTSEDNFDITLNIVTQNKIKPPIGASVVLVIDNSSSMNTGAESGGTLLDNAKAAAKEFVNTLLKDEGSVNEIGLVVFSSSVDFRSEIKLTNNKDEVLNTINKIPNGSETNIHDGVAVARHMLEGIYGYKKPKEGNSKYIVLLSDGEPNISYKGERALPLEDGEEIIGSPGEYSSGFTPTYDFKLEGFKYNFPTGEVGKQQQFFLNGEGDAKAYQVDYGESGTRTVYDNGIGAISEGFLAKKQDIEIFSIFLTSATGVNNEKYSQAKFTLSNIASKNEYSEVNDVSKITEKFLEISKNILEKINLWKLVDPMGEFIKFEGLTENNTLEGVSFDEETNTLTWSILESKVEPEEFTDTDNITKYRYKVSYKISLDRNAPGFLNYANYEANGRTFLGYYIGDDFIPGVSDINTVEFIVPVVTGGGKIESYITVKPLDMISYQGGNSDSGDTFPRPYFSFKMEDGTVLSESDMNKFKFYFDGEEYIENSHDYYIYDYPFRAYYTDNITGDIYNYPDPKFYSEHIGIYNILLTTMEIDGKKHTIIAVDDQGKVYGFNFDNGTLEVRAQNFKEKTTFTKYQLDDISGDVIDPTAVVPDGTIFLNSAGIKINDTSGVSLMKDQIFDQKKKETMESIIENHDFTKGMSYILKYLDLVDNNNGNLIVTSHKDDGNLTNEKITIYYPYPNGTDESFIFRILHFKDIKRTDSDEFQNMEEITPEKTDKGLKFTIDSFSPFAIAYKTPIYIRQVIVDYNVEAGEINEGYVTIDKGLNSYNKYIKSGGIDTEYTSIYFYSSLADKFKINTIIPTNYNIKEITMKKVSEEEEIIPKGEFTLNTDEKVWITIYITPNNGIIAPWSSDIINNNMGNISEKKIN